MNCSYFTALTLKTFDGAVFDVKECENCFKIKVFKHEIEHKVMARNSIFANNLNHEFKD